jgi:hypothetical protein
MQVSMLATIILFIAAAHCATAVPSIPPPISNNATQLQNTINHAISKKVDTFTIPPGKYIFSNSSLNIVDAKDMSIIAADVTFIFFYGYGLAITDSQNISVYGLTFDSNPPNYAQGIVTSTTSPTSFIAEFDKNFIPPNTLVPPFNQPNNLKVSFYNPNTKQMLFTTNFLDSSSPNTATKDVYNYTLTLKNQQKTGLAVGNLVTIIPRKGFTWHCNNCSNVHANQVTIFAGGNMGFLETGGIGGNRYTNVTITKHSNNLVGLNADGFHSSDVGIGPVLEDSEIAFTGDDFVNIHNRMKIVCKQLSPNSIAALEPGTSFEDLNDGDELRFFKALPHIPHVANPFLSSSIVSGSPRQLVKGKNSEDDALLKECHGAATAMASPPYNVTFIPSVAEQLSNVKVYIIEFKRKAVDVDMTILPGMYNLINFERRSGSNFIVRRNYFHDSVGTGGRIIAKAIGGLFNDNLVERFGGIHVFSEQVWLEGALDIRNVELTNNTVVDARVPNPNHVDVLKGLVNITCQNMTFIVDGVVLKRANGC